MCLRVLEHRMCIVRCSRPVVSPAQLQHPHISAVNSTLADVRQRVDGDGKQLQRKASCVLREWCPCGHDVPAALKFDVKIVMVSLVH